MQTYYVTIDRMLTAVQILNRRRYVGTYVNNKTNKNRYRMLQNSSVPILKLIHTHMTCRIIIIRMRT